MLTFSALVGHAGSLGDALDIVCATGPLLPTNTASTSPGSQPHAYGACGERAPARSPPCRYYLVALGDVVAVKKPSWLRLMQIRLQWLARRFLGFTHQCGVL